MKLTLGHGEWNETSQLLRASMKLVHRVAGLTKDEWARRNS